MTSFARSRAHPRAGARVLAISEWDQAIAVARRDPVSYVLALVHMEAGFESGYSTGEVWGYPESGPLSAVCWAGANIVPIIPEPDFSQSERSDVLGSFSQLALRMGRRCSSIVGPSSDVLALWELLDGSWKQPREIRPRQYSMAITQPPRVAPDPRVRYARSADFDGVFPASVHMFHEEVGISPLSFGSAYYAARVQELIEQRRTLISTKPATNYGTPDAPDAPATAGRVLFKSDFGAVASSVAQVQGVWIDPEFRGRGLSVAAVAATVVHGLRDVAPTVSLYVNDYNSRAVAAYRHVGFEDVGMSATVRF